MSRLEKLKELEVTLKLALDSCEDVRSIAQIAKQYRETIKEIEEIEGSEDNDDEIGALLSSRQADGKSGAVRKSRT